MRSMTFQIDDQSTGSAIPAVVVTITENADGSLSFTLSVVGSYVGDLRGFFFDLADESRIGTLSVTNTSAGFTQLTQGNDSVTNLGNGASMQGLVGSDGGYDAGIEIGTAGIGKDDYQSFSFRLASSAGALTLDDFANVDFGVRLTSVGELDGSRDGAARLLEHTTSAIDALNDANAIAEDGAPNTVSGNVFANDLHLGTSHSVTNPGVIAGTYGTLQLNADGSYTYTLNNAAVQFLAVGETRSETFAYTATASDEATSSSTDSAVLSITIAGSNDAPQITAAVAAVSVLEFAEDSPLETLGSHFVSGTVDFEDVDLSDVHGASVTPASSSYLGTLTAQVTDDSTGDGEGQVSWAYEVSDAAIEHLGLGDSLTQTYTVAVNDGHGGSDTQDVTITINGANDAPEIVAGDTNGDVFEDGSRSASGQLVAIDIDQGSELSWSVTGSGPMTPRADYRFLIDNLNIVRSGLPFFNDDFGNGVPPPAGTSFGYFTFGTFLESGGRVIMDGSQGAASTIAGITAISHLATLNTGDVNQGLTLGQSFKVEARYDLVMPADVLGTYGLRLADGANDIVEIDVRRLADGSVAVVLREANVAGTVPVTLAAIPLAPAPGDNQIVLRLEHAANSNLVSASFDLLNGGVVTQTQSFALTPDIFSDENWTRVQFNALTPAMAQNGVYGTLSVEADGQWSYALNNRAANVQALAQHDHVTDTFTVRVTDEHGASAMETVTVEVFGSNDAPIITAGDVNGFVQEDGFTSVTRQFTATDADHDHILHWSVGPQTQVPLGGGAFQVFGYSSDYHVRLDQLKVVRNGATIFDDGFDPSAPSFPNGPGNNYLTNGAGFSEDAGRLVLDGSRANSARGIGTPDLVVGHIAVLGTNIDSADLTRGLKSDDDFTVEARFDLFTPDVGQGYGLSLTDNTTNGLPPDQLGDDNVNLFVRADAAGNLSVQFSRFNIPADTVTVYQSRAFTPAAGENQIVLRLSHDADHRGIVHAEFDLLGGAGGPRTLGFTETANIFGTSTPGYAGDDEEWTRAQVVAFGLDPYDADSDPATHQGTYGSLSVQQNGEWTYALDNGSANVQALAQFQFAQDLFSIRVVDEYGMSSTRPAFISVQGSNDPVFAAGGDTSGAVSEDTISAASGTLAFTDVDLIDIHMAMFAPGGVFGTFTLDPIVESPLTRDIAVGWDYQLHSHTVQFLAEGETRTEMFLVTTTDNMFPFPGQDSQAVTVTITGTNDPIAILFGGGTTDFVEDGGLLGVGAEIVFSDPDLSDTHTATAAPAASNTTALGTFAVGPVSEEAGSASGSVPWSFVFDNDAAQSLAAGETAVETHTVTVSDGHGAFASRDVTFRIHGVNDLPTASPDNAATTEDQAISVAALANDLDIDTGDTFTVVSFATTSFYGASISLNPDGTFFYDPTDADALQDLDAGESRFDTFAYTIIDNHGATGTATVSVEVHGVTDTVNLPPIANPDTNGADLVIESGTVFGPPFPDMFASGNVLLNDFDPDADPGLPGLRVVDVEGSTGAAFFSVEGKYGTLSMFADGTWSYNLLDADGDTNALKAGEAASDEFTYSVQDSGGATAATTLTIAITGSNDFPIFAPGGNTGDVTEGSADFMAEGQLVGVDPDHDAILTYGLQFQPTNGATADYLFRIDEFTLTRMRPGLDPAPVQIFNDDFDDGLAPPNGVFPPPDNNQAYGIPTTGTFLENDGRTAVMDGSLAQPFFNFGVPQITTGHNALVTTSRDPISVAPTRGLRPGFDFDATARFDLILPEFAGQAYGISLADQRPGFGGDDHIQLLVRRDTDGVVRVVLREGDAIANSITPIDSMPLGAVAEGDQIVLHLTHDPDAAFPERTGVIVGSFDLLHADGSVESHVFSNTGRIFGTETPGFLGDDEDFTRANILATSPAQTTSRAGIYGTIAVDLDGEWRYVLNNADPDTQALAAGETAADSFQQVLVIDEFRTASLGSIDVTVHGANDAPAAKPDTATTNENQVLLVNVLTNDTDIDHGAVLTLVSASAPAGHGSASIVGNQVRFDPGTHFDHLDPGETEVVSVAYTVRDEHGATSHATLDITVTGEAEPPAADGTVFEDGGRVASGQQATPPGLDPATTTWSADLVDVEVNPDYRFLIDNFNIRRGATPGTQTQYFNDDFGDGNPPSSTPGPVNDPAPNFVGYALNGSFLEPFGLGRAVLDGPRAVVVDGIGTPETRYSTSARLNTDNSDDLDVNRGLKKDDAFTVEGRFDLVTTLEPNQRYGIRLTDAGRNNPDGSPVPATDIVELTLSRSDTGVLRVQLRELDAVADTSITLQSITLPPIGGDPQTNQIVFRLSHDPASPGLVNASFTLTGSATPQTFNFTAQGHIFGVSTPGDLSDDENWTRAEFRATSGAGLQNGDYGMLEGNPQGQWTYQLNNALPAVQQLKQGEQVFDSFEVLATDGAGNSATQVINIAVKGTNDTPVITTGPTSAIVVENGGTLQQFTGHLNASDVDHDALLTWSLSRSFTGYSASYDFTADDFTVVRNGQVIFLDTFTSPAPPAPPAPPPSAPNFANGTFANYLTTGVFSEDLAGDGRLHLHGSQARALSGTGTDDLRVGHIATLATNIDPADLTRGLKIDDDFSVHARFDLSSLPLQGQAFGLSLVDATFGGIPPDQLPQDQPLLLVTRDDANNLVLVFSSANGVTDTVHEYARTPLLLGSADTQILLRLDHTHDTGILQASYELRDAGNAVTGSGALGAPGYVFGRGTADPGDDEVWTRPSILAFARGDDEATTSMPGFFGTFSVNQSGDWTYALNPGNPLSAGQEFFESASVRVTDEHGASTFRQIGVNIVGTGDEPVFGPLVLFGTDLHNVLLGSPQNDLLTGLGGPDTLVGLGGSDTFGFSGYNAPYQGPDTIVDFQPGPLAGGGDVLNIADVIDFAPGGTASNFVRFVDVNGAAQLQINQDGIGNDFVSVATLQGVSGLLLNDLLANGNLVLA